MRASLGRVPRRSNLFQNVVGIIHAHMAEGATVEESALLVEPEPQSLDVHVDPEQRFVHVEEDGVVAHLPPPIGVSAGSQPPENQGGEQECL